MLPYGAPEARILTEGRLLVLGFAYNDLPGVNLAFKKEAICLMNPDQFTEKATIKYVMEPGDVCFFPNNFVYITIADGKTTSIRWSIGSPLPEHNMVTRVNTDRILSAYPQMSDPQMGA